MNLKSYFDWELQFKRKEKKENIMEITIKKKENKNSLDIYESDFKKFLKDWKEKNLRDIE